MSKTTKKPVKGNKKLTDYFVRSSVTSSPPSSSPLRSQATTSSHTITPSHKVHAPSTSEMQRKTLRERDISLAQKSAILSSLNTAGQLSASSGKANNPMAKRKTHPSDAELVAATKGSKPRATSPLTAKTTVRRPPLSTRSLKRKLKLDSDSDIPDIEMVPYPPSFGAMADAGPSSRRSSSGPPSSLPPVTPKDQHLSLPSDDAASMAFAAPSKRARLSPPAIIDTAVSGNEADTEDVIPSSQSDEHELIFPEQVEKDPEQTRMEVDRRIQNTDPKGNDSMDDFQPPDIPMDVDPVTSGSITLASSSTASSASTSTPPDFSDSQTSEAEADVHLLAKPLSSASQREPPETQDADLFALPSDTRSSTPPLTDEAPILPATPLALDSKTKTRLMIEQIRAGVEAARHSSPSEGVPEIADELSSSDDEDLLSGNIFSKLRNRKPSPVPSSPLTRKSTSPEPEPVTDAGRYSLRKRSPVAGPSTETSYAPNKLPRLVSSSQKPRYASSSKNPLDALLREKKTAEKRGGGSEVLAAAEAVVAEAKAMKKTKAKGKGKRKTDDASDQDEVMRFVNGQYISEDDDDDDDMDLGDVDCERILGDKGKDVGKIIRKDREGDAAEQRRARPVRGVPLWAPVPLRVTVGRKGANRKIHLPPLPIYQEDIEASPFLTCLNAAASRSDISRIALMLRPESFTLIAHRYCASLFPWLFDLAFKATDHMAIFSIFRTLECIPNHCERNEITLTHEQLVSSLIRIGAKTEALPAVHLDEIPKELMNEERRDLLLTRMVSLLVTLARKRCLAIAQIPDMILLLLSIVLDVATPFEVQHEVIGGIDLILACVEETDEGGLLESRIASSIYERMDELEAINKAYLVSFLNRASPQNARIARWLAHASLSKLGNQPAVPYSALPPLRPLVPLLSPAVGSMAAFDILGNVHTDDYFENLGYYVELLSVALSDIDGYVQLEPVSSVAFRGLSAPDSPRNGGAESPATELEQIKTLLDKLHGRITDTRAAHLERSRVKAALQQLSFRVHYQRQAAIRAAASAGSGKPRNLRGYFTATPTPVSI
ncbi:hypothetical protein BXZ70DRAFT_642181 [Cristinia sonorae]|uniref:Uncharacterized protein n=1 Tax=Cristinia sonorae TaxID=1940300 RepID=A0A8K0UFF7_9AGAR|nr:hypothetical protein BXZ70DRAFT_642181 [Cristinia sonorae]